MHSGEAIAMMVFVVKDNIEATKETNYQGSVKRPSRGINNKLRGAAARTGLGGRFPTLTLLVHRKYCHAQEPG